MAYCSNINPQKCIDYITKYRCEESCFSLIQYLMNGECIRKGIMLSEDRFYDLSVDIFMNFQRRVLPNYPHKEGWVEPNNEGLVRLIYYIVPKVFCQVLKVDINTREFWDGCVDIDDCNMSEEMALTEDMETIAKEFIGSASNNKELNRRRKILRDEGYEITNGKIEIAKRTTNQLQKELNRLQEPETIPQLEKRRKARIREIKRILL